MTGSFLCLGGRPLDLVIPAKPESWVSLWSRFARTDSRPCVFPSAILASGSLSLACPRESNQRKRHPRCRARRCATGSLRAAGVSLTAHPVPQRNERDPSRSPACGARGLSVRPSPRLRGTRDQERKALLRLALTWLLRQGLPRSALPGSLSAAARARRKQPAGARARCARVRCRHTDVPSANLRSVLAKSPGIDARRPRPRGCPSLWLLSLGQARESDPPPGWRTEKHTDVSRFSRNAKDRKMSRSQKTLDPGLRE